MKFCIENDLRYNRGIYAIKSTIDNRVYVGSAKNFKKRFHRHLSDLRKNKHHSPRLQNFFNKYGMNSLSFNILEVVSSDDSLIKREQFYLTKICRFEGPVLDFNISPNAGSNTGIKRDKEFGEKVAAGNKRFYAENESHRLGHISSKEERKNLSLAKLKGKKIAQYNRSGDFIKLYDTPAEASLGTNIPAKRIVENCCGNTKLADKSNFFVYFCGSGEPKNLTNEELALRFSKADSRKIIQSTLDGEFIALYHGCIEAHKATGFSKSSIDDACRKKRKSKGFLWRFLEEKGNPIYYAGYSCEGELIVEPKLAYHHKRSGLSGVLIKKAEKYGKVYHGLFWSAE